jgi:hypothetical protein
LPPAPGNRLQSCSGMIKVHPALFSVMVKIMFFLVVVGWSLSFFSLKWANGSLFILVIFLILLG